MAQQLYHPKDDYPPESDVRRITVQDVSSAVIMPAGRAVEALTNVSPPDRIGHVFAPTGGVAAETGVRAVAEQNLQRAETPNPIDPCVLIRTDYRYYETRCLSCHSGAPPAGGKSCPVIAKSGCIPCHMPRRPIFVNQNISITMADHPIMAFPAKR